MSNNFHYAAYSYLDEWLQKDREFHDALAYENRHDTMLGGDSGREAGTGSLLSEMLCGLARSSQLYHSPRLTIPSESCSIERHDSRIHRPRRPHLHLLSFPDLHHFLFFVH